MRFTLVICCLLSFSIGAKTNLGTLTTVRNGFANLEECKPLDGTTGCNTQPIESLRDVLNFTTTNQCLASTVDYKEKGLEIPQCPEGNEDIKGLPNTYPSAGTFAIFTGNNTSFINDFAKSYLNGNSVGKFNLILPKNLAYLIKEDEAFAKTLNNKRVNIIEVETVPKVGRWMQDSMQFTTLDGKPAIYQLDHMAEEGTPFEKRLACELARKCDIPYYIPPDMVDPYNADYSSLNSGGNLEVLPGGSFYSGIIKTPGFRKNDPGNVDLPYRTEAQERQKDALEESGNRMVELDVSFLHVGHVDEIFNTVKTNAPSPCDYAVLMASPRKAFEILEAEGSKTTFHRVPPSSIVDLILPVANAGAGRQVSTSANKGGSKENRCEMHSYGRLDVQGREETISQQDVNAVYEANCIDGVPVEDFVVSNEFKILKRMNLADIYPGSIARIMDRNRDILVEELKKTSGCSSPKVIEVPVFFRNGLSYTPDLVNGVVETPPGEASNVYLPRSYFKAFDQYVENELKAVGVDTDFVHDMGYHLLEGEVHCGSNTARVCNQ